MRLKRFITAALAAAFAMSAAAAISPQYVEWAAGPVQFLMTAEETAKWKTLTTDAEARDFVILFWARRDPSAGTPRNEFREEFEKRVAIADKSFPSEHVRGAMTDRGRTLVLFGTPKKIERTGNQRESSMPQGIGTPSIGPDGQPIGSGATGQYQSGGTDLTRPQATDKNETQIWTYEGEEARAIFNVRRAVMRFSDRHGKSEFTMERGSGVDYAGGQARAIKAAIKQPDVTLGSIAPAAAAESAVPAAVAAPVMQTALTTEALASAVAEFSAAPKSPYSKQAFATWGEYVTAGGEYFVPVMLYVPKSSGLTAAQNLTFFGVVQDETGKSVSAFEVPATLVASKDDFYVDRSFTGLPAGKHRGFFGLAENGKPVTIVSTDMQLAGSIDKDAPTVSSLILSNNVYPLTAAQRSTDPFAFGGLKVVPKGDRTFRPADELWYFVELRNPGIPEAAAGSVPVAAAPKVQVKIDVEGTDAAGNKKKMTAPPREVEATEIKGVPGHFGIGNAIPLSSFKPGNYTFTLKLIDTVRKASYTVSETFRVVE
ncbi:MAG TPA: GWxTD domain-containing protein [Thermoanaerobaculia bacterium]|nr:GWxTD domain-containing protein [Thermoanaerobaculia bacterium]